MSDVETAVNTARSELAGLILSLTEALRIISVRALLVNVLGIPHMPLLGFISLCLAAVAMVILLLAPGL